MSESEESSSRKDPAWKYARTEKPGDVCAMICGFCGKLTKGGVYRMKQHLIGGFRNATSCKKCPEHVKKELRLFMMGKKKVKELRSSNFGSTFKKPKAKGPMDAFFTPKPLGGGVISQKQTTMNATCKKKMRSNVIQLIAGWFYDAGIPLNACNHKSFAPMIEAIGKFGPGLKPPMYHELRVLCLKMEMENTIDDCHGWLVGRMEDDFDEEDDRDLVFEDDTLTAGDVSRVAGAKEPSYSCRANTSKNKTTDQPSSSRTPTLIRGGSIMEIDSEEEEDFEEYKSNDGWDEEEPLFSEDEFEL